MESDLRSGTYAVVDVETTGLDARVDGVVEVACVRVDRGTVTEQFATLVDPGRPIPARASAVHGIYDGDVAGAPGLSAVRERLLAMTDGATVVAHNARFDLAFLPFLAGHDVVCTLRLAMHLVDAPSYRNDALRALFAIPMPDGGAHRAHSDATVSAALLLCLLERYVTGPFPQSVPGLVETIARPARLGRFAFGAHRGVAVAAIPTRYLRWIVATGFEDWPDVRATAERELQRRTRERTASRQPQRASISEHAEHADRDEECDAARREPGGRHALPAA